MVRGLLDHVPTREEVGHECLFRCDLKAQTPKAFLYFEFPDKRVCLEIHLEPHHAGIGEGSERSGICGLRIGIEWY